MELCEGGSVADAVAPERGLSGRVAGGGGPTALAPTPAPPPPPRPLSEDEISRVVAGALAGIAHLHAAGKARGQTK